MFTVYSRENCTQCNQAKMLLKMKSIEHEIKMLDVDFSESEIKALAPGRKSYPVIFKDGVLIGGFMELRTAI